MTPADPWEDISDEQLMATFADTSRRGGERETAFQQLVVRYRHRVFAVCYRILNDASDAEDATQETLIKLARGAGSFRGEAKLSTWLYRVAHNVCTDRIRYEARRPSTPVDDITSAGPEAHVADTTDAHATASLVTAALEQLDERSRQLLLLVAVDELSYAEAAEATGLAVGTVKSRVSRARVKLGQLLEGAGDEPGPGRHEPGADGQGNGGSEPARPGPRGPPPG